MCRSLNFLLAGSLLLLPLPGEAQQIRGRVLDTSGAPVVGAEVRFADTTGTHVRVVLTGEGGTFTVENLTVGPLDLSVTAFGFEAVGTQQIQYEGSSLFIELRVAPTPVSTEALVASVSAMKSHLEAAGFYHRRRRGHGAFMGPEEIAGITATRSAALLRRIGSVKVLGGREPVMIRSQGFGNPLSCVPNLYVDGIAVRLQTSIEDYYDSNAFERLVPPPESIDAIEVYPGGATIPSRWRTSSSGCGVIVIWTKR